MGLLDRLKGSSDTTVELRLDADDVLPGATIQGVVSIGGVLDDKAQGARLEVRCQRVYKVLVHVEPNPGSNQSNQANQFGQGSNGQGRYREEWRREMTFEHDVDLALELGEQPISVALPGHAAPSATDAVEWSARALVDRRHGRDTVGEAPLRVLARAPKDAAGSRDLVGEQGLRLSGVPAAVSTGTGIEGSISFTPSEDLKVTGIHVRLEQIRRYRPGDLIDQYGRHDWNRGWLESYHGNGWQMGMLDTVPRYERAETILEVELHPGGELASGQAQTLEFSGLVGPDDAPTVKTKAADIEYRVVAKVARRLADDYEVAVPVVIFNAPS